MSHHNRLSARRERIRSALHALRSQGQRLRAWQHKPYESPLAYLACDGGIVVRLGGDGFDGGRLGDLLASTPDRIDAINPTLAGLDPLDRSRDRWGCGEGLARVRDALVAAGRALRWRDRSG